MTERITPEQIANVRRLNAERTQGPWLVDGPSALVVAASGRIIAKVATFLRHGSYVATVEDDMNQTFIAAAANCIIPALDELERLERTLDEERERVRQLQTYLWRIRDAVMHEGGWCYDYKTTEGKRIAEAVHVIWREARDAGLQPFATAGGEGHERVLTRRETHERAIRALGYAIPFTYVDEHQVARLTAAVRADYREKYGVDLSDNEVRDTCGLPPAREQGEPTDEERVDAMVRTERDGESGAHRVVDL